MSTAGVSFQRIYQNAGSDLPFPFFSIKIFWVAFALAGVDEGNSIESYISFSFSIVPIGSGSTHLSKEMAVNIVPGSTAEEDLSEQKFPWSSLQQSLTVQVVTALYLYILTKGHNQIVPIYYIK